MLVGLNSRMENEKSNFLNRTFKLFLEVFHNILTNNCPFFTFLVDFGTIVKATPKIDIFSRGIRSK